MEETPAPTHLAKKDVMLRALGVINANSDMLKFFKILMVEIVRHDETYLPKFISWIKASDEKGGHTPIVWLITYKAAVLKETIE